MIALLIFALGFIDSGKSVKKLVLAKEVSLDSVSFALVCFSFHDKNVSFFAGTLAAAVTFSGGRILSLIKQSSLLKI